MNSHVQPPVANLGQKLPCTISAKALRQLASTLKAPWRWMQPVIFMALPLRAARESQMLVETWDAALPLLPRERISATFFRRRQTSPATPKRQ